ncbi:MAG: SDR family NAD(P)-dependent oxidoreductase [Chlamydiales bacterium]
MKIERAFITGATGGVGEALAHLLASKGVALILSGRDPVRLEAVAKATKAKAIVIAHLEERSGRQQVKEALQKHMPQLVINNAGFGIYGEALNTSVKEQVDILKVNAEAVLEITLEAAHLLVQARKKGIVFNVSSVAGELPSPGMSVYGASKAFVTLLSQALDTELSPKGVRVLVNCPGMIATDFANRAARKKVFQKGGSVMPPQFVAQKIWQQIESGKEKMIINGYYRAVTWLATRFFPTKMIKKIIWEKIKARLD